MTYMELFEIIMRAILIVVIVTLVIACCILLSDFTSNFVGVDTHYSDTSDVVNPYSDNWDWYDGCVRGCRLAGDRAIGMEAVGQGDYLKPMCSAYCVEELR